MEWPFLLLQSANLKTAFHKYFFRDEGEKCNLMNDQEAESSQIPSSIHYG